MVKVMRMVESKSDRVDGGRPDWLNFLPIMGGVLCSVVCVPIWYELGYTYVPRWFVNTNIAIPTVEIFSAAVTILSALGGMLVVYGIFRLFIWIISK